MINIFTPLFKEIQEKNLRLSQSDFVKATLKLYDTISVPEKKSLLEFGFIKKPKEPTHFTFKVPLHTYCVADV